MKSRLKRERITQEKQQQTAKFKKPKQSPKKPNRSHLKNIPSERNRFDLKDPSTSFRNLSSSSSSSTPRIDAETSTATESKAKQKATQKVNRELQEKLFKEKPELFEKRMIIIDGSNVARSYVFD